VREWLKNRERNVRLSHYIPLVYGLELGLFNCAPPKEAKDLNKPLNPLKGTLKIKYIFLAPFRGLGAS
jgi:hypothetical protein